MKDRIRQIMESQHMTQQVFADYIGLSPATLSSIFNGRNRPTLNVVEALKKKFPNINVEWLMFGTGSMYAEVPASGDGTTEQQGAPAYPGAAGEHDDTTPNMMLDFGTVSSSGAPRGSQMSNQINSVRSTRSEMPYEEVKMIDKQPRRVIEIRVFYDDQTWDTFVPAKK